jgi:predicted DNA binding CopG/RHH family protein
MLLGMQQPATSPPASGSATFAALLASFAAPPKKRVDGWDYDDPAEDVATLSYERALRAHARYKAPQPDDLLPTAAISALGSLSGDELFSDSFAPPIEAADALPDLAPISVTSDYLEQDASGEQTTVPGIPFALERNLKCASITIRLSRAESTQLRKRAADAGMTVSAYLRSCTFEAESLRAMVKDALAQLRSASSLRPAPSPSQRGWLQFLRRMWLYTHARGQSMPA